MTFPPLQELASLIINVMNLREILRSGGNNSAHPSSSAIAASAGYGVQKSYDYFSPNPIVRYTSSSSSSYGPTLIRPASGTVVWSHAWA